MDHLKKPKRKPENENEEAPRAVRARDAAVAGAGASSSSAGPASMAPAALPVINEDMEISELCMNLSAMGEGMVHVSELFGPGRFTSRASAFDLMPGMAMDLRTGFDFNLEQDRVQARVIIEEEKPWLIIGSPMCAAFSPLMALNPNTDKVKQAMVEGVQHLFFVCEIYKTQISHGRFFLHEHPKAATSWGLWMVKEVLNMEGVVTVDCDQCTFGLWCTDNVGEALVKKSTRWMTNANEIAVRLDRKCVNEKSTEKHRHCDLMQLDKTGMRVIERYPVALVNAVLKGLRKELSMKGVLAMLEAGSHVDEPDAWQTYPEYYESIYDANSGTKLDASLVAKGREAEMDFLQKDLGAWSYDKIETCVRETGKQPIPMTWVDIY